VIKKLSVKNFKSIKEMEIDCRKINLFIGEPNAGKSNILEVLSLLSWFSYANASLIEYVRFQGVQDLFYDGDFIDESVEIRIGIEEETGSLDSIGTETKFENDQFLFSFKAYLKDGEIRGISTKSLDYSGEIRNSSGHSKISDFRSIKPYMFDKQSKFGSGESGFLMPPHGSNMFALVMANKKLRESMKSFLEDFGFKLVLKPSEKTFELLKEVDDTVSIYPYILASDTLQRMIFYAIAMESNENSTLVLEEPESHAFPDDTHRLGKKIAFDKTNQYFIATHDPYLFLAILEKAPKEDVNVFITYVKDYQTKVKCLDDEEKSKIMVYDPFANLDKFIGRLDSFVEEAK